MDGFLLFDCPAGRARYARGDHFVVGDRFAWRSLGLAKESRADQREDCAKLPPRRAILSLTLEEVLGEEEDVGGTFCEAAHEVGVPLRTEGNVDADAEALRGELALEVAADAVEHLELEGGFGNVVLGDEAGEFVNDGFVVGGDAAEDGAAKLWVHVADEVLHQLDVVGVDG